MYDAKVLNERARKYGFARRNHHNWIRLTKHFLQLLNLQGSRWDRGVNFLNFALQPVELGDPLEMKAHRFAFCMRAPAEAERDLDAFLRWVNSMDTVEEVRLAVLTAKLKRSVLGPYTTDFLSVLGLTVAEANLDR